MNVFFNYFCQRIYLVELIISANDITNNVFKQEV